MIEDTPTMTTKTRATTEELWKRVNAADVPIEIAPMVRDVLRWMELEWRVAERRETVERFYNEALAQAYEDEHGNRVVAVDALRLGLEDMTDAR